MYLDEFIFLYSYQKVYLYLRKATVKMLKFALSRKRDFHEIDLSHYIKINGAIYLKFSPHYQKHFFTDSLKD